MSFLMTGALSFVGVVMLIAVVGIAFAKLYVRTTKERAFVRTGLGGQKVVMTGGALKLPIFHEIIWVNMNTLRLEVRRHGEQSLITADRLRVDVSTEFYVRVSGTEEAIAAAAQTLGQRTLNPDELKELIEGKFVDALRSSAAQMTMDELHEKRAAFVQQVRTVVSTDLEKNGLELESVSLTGLNQTKREFFDPNNAFDAEGLTRLTQAIEDRRKVRNQIEQDTTVAINQKNLEAARQNLETERATAEAKLNNEREIAAMTAAQRAEIARREAESKQAAEQARIAAEREIDTTRVEAERGVKEATVQAATAVRLAEQNQAITVANKAKDEAAAKAEADKARALAVRAEEAVETARQTEVAERAKGVALIAAEEKARKDSIQVVVAAEAERQAADHRAVAARVEAEGQRDAALMRAEATKAEGNAAAQALREKNEAQNILSPELIAQQVKLALLNVLPGIIEASVKPLANIDSIRIADVGGLHGGGSPNATAAGVGGEPAGTGGLSDQVVASALRYRANAPLVDTLLSEVGLKSGGDMNKLLSSAAGMAGVALTSGDAGQTLRD